MATPFESASSPASTVIPVTPSWMVWLGRVLSALPMPLFLFSAYMKLSKHPMVMEGMAKFGLSPEQVLGIGIVEVACVIFYLIPQTAVLGAILLTGYLGGAILVHVRSGESFVFHIILGVVIWLGLYLRDARVRSLAPWRSL